MKQKKKTVNDLLEYAKNKEYNENTWVLEVGTVGQSFNGSFKTTIEVVGGCDPFSEEYEGKSM